MACKVDHEEAKHNLASAAVVPHQGWQARYSSVYCWTTSTSLSRLYANYMGEPYPSGSTHDRPRISANADSADQDQSSLGTTVIIQCRSCRAILGDNTRDMRINTDLGMQSLTLRGESFYIFIALVLAMSVDRVMLYFLRWRLHPHP